MSEFHGQGVLPHVPDDLTIPQFLLDSRHPTRPVKTQLTPWLIEDETGRGIGFEELRARTFGLANSLHSRWNIGDGDVVCVFSPNHVDYPVIVWAVHRLGGIITGANPVYTPNELVHQLVTSQSSLIIVHPASLATALTAAKQSGISTERIILLDLPSGSPPVTTSYPTVQQSVIDGLAREPSFVERRLKPGEGLTKLAFLSFSSGTTGKPKAVAISHSNLIANVIQMSAYAGTGDLSIPFEEQRYKQGDVSIAILPFYHIFGLVVVMHFILYVGSSLVVVPKFNFLDVLKSVQRYRINHLIVVPPMIVLLCKHPAVKKYDLSSVRTCMSGGAPLSAELMKQFMVAFPNISIGQGYGMTETCTSVSFPRPKFKEGTLGSAGQLIPGITARVIKQDGSLARPGEPGELFVKGPCMALYYLNNEEATKETFNDGWVRTGDEVYITEDGDIFILDRIKEFLKVRGFQVAPAELEGHLLSHPDVSDVCVVGIPDEYSGELPLAFVALQVNAQERVKTNPSEAERIKASIAKHVADSKTKYKWLAGGVHFIDVVPKNPSGKLLRRVLRDKAKEMKAQGQIVIKSKL